MTQKNGDLAFDNDYKRMKKFYRRAMMSSDKLSKLSEVELGVEVFIAILSNLKSQRYDIVAIRVRAKNNEDNEAIIVAQGKVKNIPLDYPCFVSH